MIKRIASYITVFCIVVSLFSVSAFAADVEAMESEQTVIETTDLVFEEGSVVSTEILPVTDGEYSVAPLAEDYGVAIASASEADWLSNIYSVLYQPQSSDGVSYSIYGLLMQVWYNALESNTWLNNINQNITAGTTLLDSMSGYLRTLVLDNYISSGVGILWADGTDKTLTSEQSFLNVVRHGLRGIGVLLNTNNDLLSENNSLLDEGNTTFASFVDLFQRFNILDAGVGILWADGTDKTLTSEQSFLNVVRHGLRGVGVLLNTNNDLLAENNSLLEQFNVLDPNSSFLWSTGAEISLSSEQSFLDIVRHGFRGVGSLMRALNSSVITVDDSLHDLISGSETDNTYSGTVTTNENTETNISSVGLGPMLNTWLDSIQHDTGLLSYMFASPEDLEAKAKSAEIYQTATDDFMSEDTSGETANLSAGDTGALSKLVKKMKSWFSTGATVGNIVDVVDSGEMFIFFSDDTASDLDNVPVVYSWRDNPYDTSAYDEKYAVLSQIYGGGE